MYLYVKAVHIFAVAFLVGGILLLSLMLLMRRRLDGAGLPDLMRHMLRWDSGVTIPALATVWLTGYTMAFGGGWEQAHWFWLKLVFVIFLTLLHMLEGAILRRWAAGGGRTSSRMWMLPAAGICAFAAVIWLVVVKPF